MSRWKLTGMSIVNCLLAMVVLCRIARRSDVLKMFRIRHLSYLGFYALILGLFSMVMYMTM